MRVLLLVLSTIVVKSFTAPHICNGGQNLSQKHNLVKLFSTNTVEKETIMSAFAKVKQAAAAFPEDSEERKVATSMVNRLASINFESWNSDDMELIDQCLIEENEACENFCAAMTTLRELYDKSPGNA
mmetsp:Transcript_19198/g.24913  ORF Transcript_19198/g.24913 Transcript_19198/m.24913 type:complete len:128 (+) Transcript_19198:40-423(+)